MIQLNILVKKTKKSLTFSYTQKIGLKLYRKKIPNLQ